MTPLIVEKTGHVAVVTLNRPERRNAFSPEMIVRLADAWADIEADREIRVAVLTGADGPAFCSGGDLGELVPLATGARKPESTWDHRFVAGAQELLNAALLRRTDFFTPVIAAINGDAYAGGMEITLSADLRVAADTARFALPEVRRGIIPSGGSLTRLARQIGWTSAMEIVLTGQPISADEAWRIGLVNRVVPKDAVLETALELADQIAHNAPLAVAKAKETMTRGNGLSIDESFVIEAEAQNVVMASRDAREGPRAFMEKREPRFTGE